MESNPLRLLSKLRRFDAKVDDPSVYLQRQMHQNLKAIEDAFRRIGRTPSTVEEAVAESLNLNWSASSGQTGSFSTAGTASVPELAASITTTGGPVLAMLLGNGGVGNSDTRIVANASASGYARIRRDGTDTVWQTQFSYPQTVFSGIGLDSVPGAGTYSYEVYLITTSGSGLAVAGMKLLLIELPLNT